MSSHHREPSRPISLGVAPLESVWLVRHGQSAGNVAAEEAAAIRGAVVAVEGRDADVPLSVLGERQSRALGRWFGKMPSDGRPTAILSSPYARARQTAVLLAKELGGSVDLATDERLRERELGSFDGLTQLGWTQRHPEQAELRNRLGKFYHRPPGGESWCDVVLRLRTVVQELESRSGAGRLLIVSHQVVVLCLRYILEKMDEATILRIDLEAGVPNCSVSSYAMNGVPSTGGRVPALVNFVAPLEAAGEIVTVSRDEPVAPR